MEFIQKNKYFMGLDRLSQSKN